MHVTQAAKEFLIRAAQHCKTSLDAQYNPAVQEVIINLEMIIDEYKGVPFEIDQESEKALVGSRVVGILDLSGVKTTRVTCKDLIERIGMRTTQANCTAAGRALRDVLGIKPFRSNGKVWFDVPLK